MLITSKIDGEKWLWINVPKTGSTAIMKTFFPQMKAIAQEHHCWEELIDIFGPRQTFTVVRDPIKRFRSALNHTFSPIDSCVCTACIRISGEIPTTIQTIQFVADMIRLKQTRKDFFRAIYKNGETNYEQTIRDFLLKRFSNCLIPGDPRCVRISPYVSQTYMLEGPQELLTVIKYENQEELSDFINQKLGYTLVTKKYRDYPNGLGVDFSDPTLLDLLHELYSEDFKNFNY
jgi:hypothetical protein